MDTTFIDELASSAPTPGGGGASAYVGAVASALASMVGELTLGKRTYADVQDEVIGCLGRLGVLRARLLELVDEDARAFAPLAEAYGMPKETAAQQEAKEAALQAALADASLPPLAIMQACVDVLRECDFLARNGSRLAISDAGACAVLAKAATISASLNVYINANSLSDATAAERLRDTAAALVEEAADQADATYAHVAQSLGVPQS